MNASSRWLMGIFAIVFVSLSAGGVWFYRSQERQLRQQAEATLRAVAELKARQIADWRAERLDDISLLVESPFLRESMSQWLTDPRPEMGENLLTRFRSLASHQHYSDVLLIDAQCMVRLSLSGRTGSPAHAGAAEAVEEAWSGRRAVLSHLHTGPGNLPSHIDVVAPIFADDGQGPKPVGAIVLRSDAELALYPLVDSWPVPSGSAESLLVRRDGNSVLFVNHLRHQKDTPLKLRVPLTRKDLPAVMAVEGREGIVEGTDYRSVEVLCALKPVADCPWFLVAKVDKDEALAAWRTRSALIVSMVLCLLAAIAAATGVFWLRNGKEHYRTLFQSESARRRSEQRYRTTLLSIGDGVVATDEQGRVELLNPVAEALTGWGRDEARGRDVSEVFHIINEDNREEVENPVTRVLAEGLVVGLANHTLLIARDGVERPISDSGAPIKDPQGRTSGVVLVFRDQTRQRKAQNELRRLNRALRAITDCNHALVRAREEAPLLQEICRIIEQIGGYSFCCVSMAENDEARTVRGVAQSGAEPAYLDGANVTWADTERGRGPTGTAIRTGRPSVVQDTLNDPRYALWRDMAATRGVHSSAAFPLMLDDKAFGALTVCSDTPNAFSEEEMALLEDLAADLAFGIASIRTAGAFRARREELQAVHDNISVMTCLVDADRNIVFANRALARFAGKSEEQLIGRRACGVLGCVNASMDPRGCGFGPRCTDCSLLAVLEDTLRTGKAHHDVQRELTVARDGQQRDVILVGSTTMVHFEPDARLLLCLEDVTERKRAQEEKELLQAQYLQAQKLEAIGQLAGGVAHDFRNQLTVIKGFGEMLLRRGLVKPDGVDKLKEMLKAAERSALLTGQLLAFSRKQALEVRPTDLTKLIADIGKAIPQMVGEDTRLTVRPCSKPCITEIDSGQFQQAILNLVANAHDAMPTGGELTIEVSCGEVPAPVRQRHDDAGRGAYGCVTVGDTGCGMDEATIARLFEPFFTTKEVGKGTGLGLSMVYGFVKQSGGFIDVQSRPGEGSAFALYLPMSTSRAASAGQPDGQAARLFGGTETILVVEDEDAVRGTLVESLSEAGYTVLQADGMARGLEIMAESRVDMLITDVIMPGGSGLNLARRVRQDCPGVKILFVSGYAGDELDRRGVTLDPANMLTKPCAHDVLLRKVREILDGPSQP